MDVIIAMEEYNPMIAIAYIDGISLCFDAHYNAFGVPRDKGTHTIPYECFKANKLPVEREVFCIGRVYNYLEQYEVPPTIKKINVDKDGFMYFKGKKVFLAKPTDKNVDITLTLDLKLYDKYYDNQQGFYYDENGEKHVFYSSSILDGGIL